jgi:hypothetical protein
MSAWGQRTNPLSRTCAPFTKMNPCIFRSAAFIGLPILGRIALELIEVQVGSYLGEDDIVRIDDVYGRAPPNGGSG